MVNLPLVARGRKARRLALILHAQKFVSTQHFRYFPAWTHKGVCGMTIPVSIMFCNDSAMAVPQPVRVFAGRSSRLAEAMFFTPGDFLAFAKFNGSTAKLQSCKSKVVMLDAGLILGSSPLTPQQGYCIAPWVSIKQPTTGTKARLLYQTLV